MRYDFVTTKEGYAVRRRSFLQTAIALAFGSSGRPASAKEPPMRIGLTAVILNDQAAFLSRWSAYLSERLNCQVTFAARESYQVILDLLFAGQLDAAWICGYPYVLHQSRLKLLAVPLYQGKPLYQSYLIRHRQPVPEVAKWADLRGKVFAYSDPLSNSGWLVAQGQLAAAGLAPADLKKTFFAHGHRNVAEAVAARLAQAGSIDGYVWETMRAQGMAAVARTEIAWKSELHGFPPLVYRPASSHPKTRALQAVLLTMHRDASGEALLKSLNLTGFETGEPALFDSIRRMAAAVASRAT